VLSGKENQRLNEALSLLGFSISQEQEKRFALYLSGLMKWNRVYNLTGFKTFEENLIKNILDCLSVAPFISGEELLDVGTGAGLPGFLLAIMDEHQQWTLLDANGKKIRFLQQMASSLGLENVTLVNERVQDYKIEQRFDGISTRAFDKISDTLLNSEHLLKPESHFYALKGKNPEQELKNLPAWVKEYQVREITVPLLNEERHLVDCLCFS